MKKLHRDRLLKLARYLEYGKDLGDYQNEMPIGFFGLPEKLFRQIEYCSRDEQAKRIREFVKGKEQ